MSSPPARGCSHAAAVGVPSVVVVPARAGVFRTPAPTIRPRPGRPRPRGGVPPRTPGAGSASSSSPPARGCSAACLQGFRADFVVPARAGVFLAPAPRIPSAPGRPRPRGGVPASRPQEGTLFESSPPARGCSLLAAQQADPYLVVPARAGVFRCRGTRSRQHRGRPRPRGGVPRSDRPPTVSPRSSPPARGCSPDHDVCPPCGDVVPARAGVFRSTPAPPAPRMRRPRPRGGVPEYRCGECRRTMSSPPARGCSSSREAPPKYAGVVPARAGVFRRARCAGAAPSGRPRPRGGVPPRELLAAMVNASSPPARGCSVLLPAHRRLIDVVPARAGVFRAGWGVQRAVSGRPRPRGGVPSDSLREVVRILSSPPARGCSPTSPPARRADGVVPARAGVFPPALPVRLVLDRRPRPRGGVPRARVVPAAAIPSSPPARGCSYLAVVDRPRRIVVPARAGVFRRAPRPPTRRPRRPRPRGGVPLPSTVTDISVAVVPARAGVFRSAPRAHRPPVGRPRPRGGVPRPPGVVVPPEPSSPPARGCSRVTNTLRIRVFVVPARAGVFRPGVTPSVR